VKKEKYGGLGADLGSKEWLKKKMKFEVMNQYG
jgi:hypothetical protein